MGILSYSEWRDQLSKHLDILGESEVLTDDEWVNADKEYNDGTSPSDYAAQLAARREYDQAKFSGDLYR